jgi:hypothetical protein
MLSSQAHSSGLFSTVPIQMKLALEIPSTVSTVQSPSLDLPPMLSKFVSQGGSILAFLIVLCFLTQAITSLVKAIKE